MFSFVSPAANARFYLFGVVLAGVWIVISLRIWVRITKRFTWDDGICVFSALLFTGFCTTAVLAQQSHDEDLEDSGNNRMVIALSIASSELYAAAIGFVKVSIILFFRRYIETTLQRLIVYATLLVISASGVFTIVVALFECNVLPKQNACVPPDAFNAIELSTSITNAATSWALAIIPIFIMASRSQGLSIYQQVCSGCAILLGGFASVISVTRILCVSSVVHEGYLVPLSALECGTAIIAASAVTLQPLFRCLKRPSPVADYIDRSGSEKCTGFHHEPFMFEHTAPSRSHFSLFSEASFGPKAWFKHFAAEEDIRMARNRTGVSNPKKPAHKGGNGKLVVSHPIVGTAGPPPLNRTESQQYLLRNGSDTSLLLGAGTRSKPLVMCGEVERRGCTV